MAALQQPSDDELNETGVPETVTIRKPRTVGGLFADGMALLSTNTYTQVTAVAGSPAQRLRGKFTCAGTLSFLYRRPPPNAGTAYSASLEPPHADVPVVANTEFLVDMEPVGEPYLAITFAPSGNGAVTFLDILAF